MIRLWQRWMHLLTSNGSVKPASEASNREMRCGEIGTSSHFSFLFSGHCIESTPRRASICHQGQHQGAGRCMRSFTPSLHYAYSALNTFTESPTWPLRSGQGQCPQLHPGSASSINEVVHIKSPHLNLSMIFDIILKIPENNLAFFMFPPVCFTFFLWSISEEEKEIWF